MSSVSGKAIDTKILRRIYKYLQPYRKYFYISVTLTILLAIIAPVRPYLVQYCLDHYILNNDASGLLYASSICSAAYSVSLRISITISSFGLNSC